MSKINSKIIRKQCLHGCDYFCVWLLFSLLSYPAHYKALKQYSPTPEWKIGFEVLINRDFLTVLTVQRPFIKWLVEAILLPYIQLKSASNNSHTWLPKRVWRSPTDCPSILATETNEFDPQKIHLWTFSLLFPVVCVCTPGGNHDPWQVSTALHNSNGFYFLGYTVSHWLHHS